MIATINRAKKGLRGMQNRSTGRSDRISSDLASEFNKSSQSALRRRGADNGTSGHGPAVLIARFGDLGFSADLVAAASMHRLSWGD